MPNISSHMIVAKEVGKRLNINSDDYYKGNLLPDIIISEDSHSRIAIGVLLIPDIDKFLSNNDINNDLYLGYLVHLLLDKHFLEDYIMKITPDKNIFDTGEIYKDYDYLNDDLVKRFNLDVEHLDSILNNFEDKILEDKLVYVKNCLKAKKEGTPVYLDLESLSRFLIEVSETISKEIIAYENKSS